jgi:hypothetical protein
MAKKKKNKSLSFADITGGKRRNKVAKKKLKKTAKHYLSEMKIKRKKFKEKIDYSGSTKKALRKYRLENANNLADILLDGHLKNSDRFEDKLQSYIEGGKLFDVDKRGQMRKVARKQPGLFAYANIVTPMDSDIIRDVMKKRVKRLEGMIDDKAAVKIAPLVPRADASKVLRVIIKIAADKDDVSFSAREFFSENRPKGVSKKDWKETVVSTVLGIRGHKNNALKDIANYAIKCLGDMPKDRIKKLLKRYADNITKVAESGEKLNYLVSIKDLSDDSKIAKVLDKNPKIANVINQI